MLSQPGRAFRGMSHRIHRTLAEKALRVIPFGLGQTKPKHFRDMAQVAWENRDNLGTPGKF